MDQDLTQSILRILSDANGRFGFASYVACCLAGQVLNAVWLWLKREIPCIAERFTQDARATIVSMLTNLSGVASVAILIPFDSMPLRVAVVMGLLQGISSDSVVNRNSRPVWTPDEREKKTKKGTANATTRT